MKNKIYIIIVKTVLSCLSIALLFIDIFIPNLDIGYITIILLLLSVLPWIGNLKSLEIFNVGKVEWFSKEQKENIKANTEALKKTKIQNKKKNPYFFYADNIPLTLAQLRMELEKKLSKLCRQHMLKVRERIGIGRMTDALFKEGVIDSQERNIIKDLLPSMNSAVHGKLDVKDSDKYIWVLEVSEKLLSSIDSKLEKNTGPSQH